MNQRIADDRSLLRSAAKSLQEAADILWWASQPDASLPSDRFGAAIEDAKQKLTAAERAYEHHSRAERTTP